MTLLIVIVGVIILIQSRKSKEPAPDQEIPTVPYESVLPPNPSNAAAPAVEPDPVESASNEAPAAPAAVVEESIPTEPAEPSETVPAPAVTAGPEGDRLPSSPEALALVNKAIEERKAERVIAARDLFNEALKLKLNPTVRDEVKVQLAKLAEQWLFSGDVLEGDTLTGYYKVMPGDLLAQIGKVHKVPYEGLMEINNIRRPELLQAGKRIKIVHGPFHTVVDKRTFTMDLYLQTMFVKSYRVGLGEEGPDTDTPTGLWRVSATGKLIRPVWTHPVTKDNYLPSDPDYPLGSRWIGLEGLDGEAEGKESYAIHGTKDPESIGTRSSMGCIRLFNGDVVEVYNLLYGGHSLVKVVD